MLESKDPAITLFGKKIPFPAISDAAAEKEKSGGDGGGAGEEDKSMEKDGSADMSTDVAVEQQTEDSPNPETSPEKNNDEDDQNNTSNTKYRSGEANNNNSKDQKENANPQDNNHQPTKPLKKPDKVLPCPRCNSMDTKFCYYNNYNINQPRHFCKACQRYWTAGGTMRNVPVGAGRRKNKNSSSHYRHITISEALQAARIDSSHHPGLKTNGRVLNFGLEAQHGPICNSMASVLKLGDQKILNGVHNGLHSFGRIENGDDCSSGSALTTSNNHSIDESRGHNCRVQEMQMMKNNNNMNAVFPCMPGVSWPYAWNPAVPPSGFFPPPGFPMPFYPYWSVPVLSPQSSSSSQKGSNSSGPNSPTLGKHSRDEENGKREDGEKVEDAPTQRNGCVLVPKTLRIDDPKEAAKSSIWATLGIKNELMSKGGMFKAFDQKEEKTKERKGEMAETSPILCANPAALSRSLDFHERT